MPFTVGNAQKLVSLCIKHAWCHGLFAWEPDSAPIDKHVLKAARQETQLASGVNPPNLGPWSSFDPAAYLVAWTQVANASGLCGLVPAEWELRVFAPGNGATPLGGPLPPGAITIAAAKAAFLTANIFAANPGSTPLEIAKAAKHDARHAAFLQGARPYDLSKTTINSRFPGQFSAFKSACENMAWELTMSYAALATPFTRMRFDADIANFVATIRGRYLFV